jgi:hypothetical protein
VRARGRLRRTVRGDDGQVLLLAIAYAVLALLLVTTVASATAVHLERKRLVALADQTALAAADALDREAYYARRTDGPLVQLTDASVRAAAEVHLAASPGAARLSGLRLVTARTDGRTAEVTLVAVARPAVMTWVTAPWSDGIGLQATARARAG